MKTAFKYAGIVLGLLSLATCCSMVSEEVNLPTTAPVSARSMYVDTLDSLSTAYSVDPDNIYLYKIWYHSRTTAEDYNNDTNYILVASLSSYVTHTHSMYSIEGIDGTRYIGFSIIKSVK